MAQLTCDLCGGKLVMRPGGVGVCEGCSMEYSLESLREKMGMPAGSAPAAPAVQVSAQEQEAAIIAKELEQAKRWMQTKDYHKVQSCCSTIHDIDNTHQEAWYLSTLARVLSNPQYCLPALTQGRIQFTDEALWEKLTEEACAVIPEIASRSSFEGLSKDLRELYGVAPVLARKCIVTLVEKQNQILQTRGNAIRKLFEEEQRNRPSEYASCSASMITTNYEFDRYTQLIHSVLRSAKELILLCEEQNTREDAVFLKLKNTIRTFMDDALKFTCWSSSSVHRSYTYTHTQVKYLSSSSRVYQNLEKSLAEAMAPIEKREREQELKRLAEEAAKEKARKAAEAAEKKRRQAEEAAAKKKQEEQRQAAIAQYWQDHAADKQALEQQQAQYRQELTQLEKRRKQLQDPTPHNDRVLQIQSLQEQYNGLGIFQGKQKKQLSTQIETATRELEAFDKDQSAQLRDAETKINNINYQLKQLAKKLENPPV